MGKQLESLSRGLGMKIPIQITEGSKRPEPPIQAAKFASEGGITLRQHIPIFHHWKEYKKKENEPTIRNYIGKDIVRYFYSFVKLHFIDIFNYR